MSALKYNASRLIFATFASVIAFASLYTVALAQPSYTMNYQGKLTDPTGLAVADGLYTMEFKLYTVSSGGTAVWTETRNGGNQVTVQNGLFSVMLGSVTPLTSVNFNQALYLGVNIAADGEMVPRKIIGTVPSAFEAKQLGGVASSSFLRSDQADIAGSLLTFNGGLISNSSSTLARLNFTNATGTSLFIGGDQITDFVGTGLTLSGSTLTTTLGADITAAEIANGDHGFFSYASGVASLDTGGLTSANLLAALTNETGSGGAVFSISPSISTPTFFDLAVVTSISTATFNVVSILDGGAVINIDGGTAGSDLNIGLVSGDAGTIKLGGSGVRISEDGDGALTFLGLGNGSDEDITLNLDDTANTGVFTSSTGLNQLTFTGIGINTTASTGYSLFGTRYFYASTTNDSIVIGENAGATFNTNTTNNVALGFEAGRFASSASADFNNYMGYQAGYTNTGSLNNIIGAGAGLVNTGSSNNILGVDAGSFADGSHNVLIGSSAGYQADGSNNNIIGRLAGYFSSGSYNEMMGYLAGRYLQSTSSVAIGAESLAGTTPYVSLNNTAVGYRTGYLAEAGAGQNILLGYQAADNLTTGNNNIIIGYDIDNVTATADNRLNIGNLIFGTGLDGTGTTLASGDIGIGTTTPRAKLSVTNIGSSPSFWVEDIAADATPFVIDASGNVGIGTSAPASLFTVGASDAFQINSSGVIASSNNLTPNSIKSVGQTDEYCLTYEVTGTTFEWQTCGAGGGLSSTDIDTSSELATILTDETGTGALVFGTSPTFSGTISAAAATLSSTLTLSGSAANIALGSNWLSGDGGDEGIAVSSTGLVGIGIAPSSMTELFNVASAGGSAFIAMEADHEAGFDTAIKFGFALDIDPAVFTVGVDGSDSSKFKISSGDALGTTDRFIVTTTGSVGIGDATPASLFTVGSGDLFQINSSGVIASSNNLTPNSILSTGQTDEYCLTYESTGTTFEWQTCGAGGGLTSGDIDTSSELAAILTDETGTGVLVFGTSPTLVTPNLGTPTALTLTNATGLPVSTGISGLAAGIATWLGTPSSANLLTSITDETGTGALVFATSPTFTGTISAAAATLSSTLTFSGSAANIALGSNWLSGDGGDEGVFVDASGKIGVGTSTSLTEKVTLDDGALQIRRNTSGGLQTFLSLRDSSNAGTWAFSLGNEAVRYLYIGGAASQSTSYFWRANWNNTTDAANTFKSASNSTAQTVLAIMGAPSQTGDYFHINTNGATTGDVLKVTSAGRLGIGDTSPDAKLDFDLTSTNTNAATEYGSYFTVTDTGVVTTGTDNSYGSRVDLIRSGATGGTLNNYGEYTSLNGTFASGAGTLNNYGQYIDLVGSTAGVSTNYGLYVNVASADTNYAAIFTGGKVGIGTTTPISTLSVQGSLCVRDTGACGTTDGTIYATTASITDIDLAENYRAVDTTIAAGEIVALDPTEVSTIKRAEIGETVLGVISTKPGLLLGQSIKDGKPVALKGRIPVKVNMEGGDISVGDAITLSSEAGIGTKATSTTYVVGIALEGIDEPGVIELFVQNQTYFSAENQASLGQLFAEAEDSENDDDTVWSRLRTLANNFVNGVLSVAGVKTNELCVGSVCVDEAAFLEMVENSNGSYSPPPPPDPPVDSPPTDDPSPDPGDGSEGDGEEPPPEAPPSDSPPEPPL